MIRPSPDLPRLQSAEELGLTPKPSVLVFLESLHQDEYTGLVVLHFCQGIAKKAEFPGKQVALARE